jgi:poly(3-hydroxybutyrate) depolymerase
VIAAIMLCAAASARSQLIQKSTTFDGLERIWFECVPASYDGVSAVPLVIALHGSGDSGDQFAATTLWPQAAGRGGFIVVFPNGSASVGNIWNVFFLATRPDDVAWLQTLIARIEQTYHIDRDRIFMTGFSNGASMVSTFAGVHSELLAGIAPVSGHWITAFYPPIAEPESLLQPKGPLPVWIWRGQNENFVSGSQPRNVQDQNAKLFWMDIDYVKRTPVLSRIRRTRRRSTAARLKCDSPRSRGLVTSTTRIRRR